MAALANMKSILTSDSAEREDHATILPKVFAFLKQSTDLYDLADNDTQEQREQSLLQAFRQLSCRDLAQEARLAAEAESARQAELAAMAEAEQRARDEAAAAAEKAAAVEHERAQAAAAQAEAAAKADAAQAAAQTTAAAADASKAAVPSAAPSAFVEPHTKTGGEAVSHAVGGLVAAEMTEDAHAVLKDLKLKRKYRYFVMKIEGGSVVPDCTGAPKAGPAELRAALPFSDCRYCVYDQEFKTPDGRATGRLLFITWLPHNATPYSKMAYAHGKTAVRRKIEGMFDVAASSFEDIESALGLDGADSSDDSDSDA